MKTLTEACQNASLHAIKSDYQLTGNMYPKLDCYMISQRPETFGVEIYMGSSCQFKTQKKFKQYMLHVYGEHLTLKIVKGY